MNHNGDYERARRLLEVAADCGCDGVNFHKRSPEATFGREALWRAEAAFPELGKNAREVARRLDLDGEAFARLREFARGRLTFWGTPFDLKSLEFLDHLEVDGFYVPAGCNTDTPLLDALSSLKRPVFVSTAACDADEVSEIVRHFEGGELTLLHGVACSPMRAEEGQLQMLQWLRQFDRPIGYDDHEEGLLSAPVAVALGARVLQKRLTLDRRLPGSDHAFSAEPDPLRRWVDAVRRIERALSGPAEKRVLPQEHDSFDDERRSVVAAVDIPQGSILTREMLTTKAPLRGLTPRMLPRLLGRRALYHIQKDEPITFGLVEVK
ncbi:MAG: N-acetylneuraminate synthase family protein [Nitrospinota bacterium]